MEFSFGFLNFAIKEKEIFLLGKNVKGEPDFFRFVAVQVAGEDRASGAKCLSSSELDRFEYVRHTLTKRTLEIVQRSPFVEATTVFEKYEDTNALRIFTEVKNLSKTDIVLQTVSSFVLEGFGSDDVESSKNTYFYSFTQSHHGECQPRRQRFFDFGLHKTAWNMFKRLQFVNIGSWSTKAQLPQGIIENAENGNFIMFQIESNNSWYYEICDQGGQYYLFLGGANEEYGAWSKKLAPNERYRTVNVALTLGNSVQDVLNQMTLYRRHISKKREIDEYLPTIFNEYMHLSWDNPTEENTAKIAPVVAKTGVEYYVIDCGWHNEEPGNIIYPYVGQWKESKARFPSGLRKTTDFIRSLGMKPGLWIEPEIIGCKCQEMLDYYDDDCFLQRHGKRLSVMGRHFLDFRNEKVRATLTETIRRMVEDYGAEYIKMDYNQDCGTGTDYLAYCAGEGLEQAANAYLAWTKDIQARFPHVLFETCSSGGMRMDYRTLSEYTIVSTSDQTNYLNYPYIAGNILSAVLPEQAAVWSYPVDTWIPNVKFEQTKEWANEHISEEQVIMNMINSFLGRMHLASHLELLSNEKFERVKEGVSYYKTFALAKKTALPYLPLGFTAFGETLVASGLETDDKIYLAVWNLGETPLETEIPLARKITDVKIAYPLKKNTEYFIDGNSLKIRFESGKIARFFELTK